MTIPDSELLLKIGNTPGYCSSEEAQLVLEWLKYFNSHLQVYKSVFGEPTGFSVDSVINKIEYYAK